jgi:nicotinamide-nucleotide amidase
MKPELELVTTGAELLNGHVVNRHAHWLGGQLDVLGWRLVRDTTVADDPAHLREALRGALARVEVVVVTGGLGPTSDDITRNIAAEWFGAGLVMHEPSRQAIVRIYQKRNKPLNAMVERHALVVDGAIVLENRQGLAPGEHLQKDVKTLFLLPGPPREFQGVMRDHVLPWLREQGVGASAQHHVFQTCGWGESDLCARLDAEGYGNLRVETAYCAQPSRVTVRLRECTGQAPDFNDAVSMVRRICSEAVYAETEETIEEAVVREFKSRGLTLAVAESCTGGLVGQRVTQVPGASAIFRGGVIAYHNDLKADVLGVDREVLAAYGAVSAPVAQAMAEGARRITGADIGVSITGVAGPDGGTAEKPVGLVYCAAADRQGTEVREFRWGGDREVVREASATMALDLARRLAGRA